MSFGAAVRWRYKPRDTQCNSATDLLIIAQTWGLAA
jgi:hypothetical protein